MLYFANMGKDASKGCFFDLVVDKNDPNAYNNGCSLKRFH